MREVTRRRLLWAGTVGFGGALVAMAKVGLDRMGQPSASPPARPSPSPTARPRPTGTPAPAPTATSPAPTATSPGATATSQATPVPEAPLPLPEPAVNRLPRWRGFNLQEMFNTDWGVRHFQERDFEWIAELGFNFVRLPMDYRAWAEPHNRSRLVQGRLEWIDQAIRWAERYQIHVCVNFHRAPGHSVTPPAEPTSLWTDEEAQRVCLTHWEYFAKRYKDVPNRLLSFNLFNEPPPLDPQVHRAVVGRMMEAIRKEDNRRLVICDGPAWATVPPTELTGMGVAAATRGYEPMRLTHYQAEWIQGADGWERPTYPLREGTVEWTRETLRQQRVEPWKLLESRGMGVLIGEFGAYNRTPHRVVLAWMRDSLQLWRDAGWGWALWNFRGPFGILDSGRTDVSYENWRGAKLDRAMLELLQSF